jgi:colanic acid biosynthesis glycosyl transferase WcaI
MKRGKETYVWILSELYYPEDSATGHNVTKVSEGLATSFHVNALCSQPTYQARGIKAKKNELHNNVQIHRCAASTLNKDILAFRIINLITISASICINILFKVRKGDIVLVVTNPPTLPFAVFIACKIRGAKIILRVEDVYPDALIAAGMVRPDSMIVKVIDALQRRIYKGVDKIVVLGRDMMKLVQGKITGNISHITLITNFADSDQILPLPRNRNSLLQRLGLADKFVVQYSGNMGRTHGIECLVEAAIILAKENSIHFLFIGFGAKQAWLKSTVHEHGLKNVTVLPMQPRSDLNDSLNACDLAVISFVKGMSGISVPCRMYNIMSAGKPILAVTDKDSELAQVVEEEQIGWVVQPEMPQAIVQAVLESCSNRVVLSRMAFRARTLALEKYSLASCQQQYKILVDSMVGSNTTLLQSLK